MTLKNGEVADADEVMNVMASIWNDTTQNLFNAAYLGFDSKLNGSGTPNLKNVYYSTFSSDDADVNYGFVYDGTYNYYYTPDLSSVGSEYVIIEADDDSINWSSNDTRLLKISNGKWILYGTGADTDAVKRAKIHKSLWYGTSGTPLITSFTNITALKTSHTNDVGKRAIGVYFSNYASTGSYYYTGTFSDTTNNLNCSSWSKLSTTGGSSDEFGTDTSSEEKDNPTNCQIALEFSQPTPRWEMPDNTILNQAGSSNTTDRKASVIILCIGSMSWSGSAASASNTDYYIDLNVPLMTLSGTLSEELNVGSTLIFKDTTSESVTNAIPVINNTVSDFGLDVAFGITPTVSGDWNTTPTNLENLTNGVYNEGTTAGITIGGSTPPEGIINLDLGDNIHRKFISYYLDLTSSGTVDAVVYLEISEDGAEWETIVELKTNTSLDSKEFIEVNKKVRYIRFRQKILSGSAGSTSTANYYSLQVGTDSNVQISVSADGGSNWTESNNAEIVRPSAGTDLWRKIVITRTDLSKEERVTEQAIKYNLY